MTDTTLYELPTKNGILEESPSGRLLLDDEPLLAGEPIALRVGNGIVDCVVIHDAWGWYGRTDDDGEYALMPGRQAWRVTKRSGPEWREISPRQLWTGGHDGWELRLSRASDSLWLWRAFDIGGRVGCRGTARSFDEARQLAEDFARRNRA